MRHEDMLYLCQELIGAGVKSITFTGGGEPLVNPHTIGMIKAFGSQANIGLVTNGVAIDNNKLMNILVRRLRYIRISLDAWSPQTYYKMKNIDKFSKVIKAIKKLVKLRNAYKSNMQIGIAYIIHKDNWQEVYPATLGLRNIGVDYIAIRPVVSWSKNYFPDDEYDNVIKEVKKCQSLQTDSFKVFANTRRINEVCLHDKNFSRCLSTPLIGIVGADMNIYICCQMRLNKRWSIGRIDYKEGIGFFDLWGSEKHKKIIDSIDVRKCVPCRNSRYNEIIESFFISDNMHRNFL